MEVVRRVVRAKDLRPGEVGVDAKGSKFQKVGPMERLERTDLRGWIYTLSDEDETVLKIAA